MKVTAFRIELKRLRPELTMMGEYLALGGG